MNIPACDRKTVGQMIASVVVLGALSWFIVLLMGGCVTPTPAPTGGYTQATGEITAGVMIEFKAMPPDNVSRALARSGASGGGLLWSFQSISTDAARDALTLALAHGAVLPGGKR